MAAKKQPEYHTPRLVTITRTFEFMQEREERTVPADTVSLKVGDITIDVDTRTSRVHLVKRQRPSFDPTRAIHTDPDDHIQRVEFEIG